ncbi:MAG: hypothetical protein V7K64_30315 [Nostoc sp.]|uniref:hypothetical protein n=1 Tax=Nostoc sp. TaxID=1180 RepID=UPI002FF1DEC5
MPWRNSIICRQTEFVPRGREDFPDGAIAWSLLFASFSNSLYGNLRSHSATYW